MTDEKPRSGLGIGVPWDKIIEVAQKAGKIGMFGVGILIVKSIVIIVEHFAWNRAFLDTALDELGSIGYYCVALGVLAGVKRGNDMTAVIGAESKIDRAEIANGLDGGIKVSPVSADPAVQREIVKQQNGGHVEALKKALDRATKDQQKAADRSHG